MLLIVISCLIIALASVSTLLWVRQRGLQEQLRAVASATRKLDGAGLGLIISKRIVELMGGEIWMESEPSVGTTCHFTAWCGIARTESSYLQRLPGDTVNARVLVVDDDAIWLRCVL